MRISIVLASLALAACQVPDKFLSDGGGDVAVDGGGDVTLTVTRSGGGDGAVTAPGGLECGAACTLTVARGTTLTLTAVPASGSDFVGWSGGGCSGSAPCTLTLTADTTIDAGFDVAHHTVTVGHGGNGGGLVTSVPAGIACGADCAARFAHGATVTLAAVADPGSTFVGWTGGGCSGTGGCTLEVTADVAVQASFALDDSIVVTLAGTGTGVVASSPAGIDCGANCAAAYSPGTIVTLTATPTGDSSFAGWSGACAGTGVCTITASSAILVTATFTLHQHTLTVATRGSGSGVVTSSPAGIDCGADCAHSYDAGVSVVLTATPTSGRFAGWSGACAGLAPCTVVIAGDRDVTATFNAITVDDVTSSAGDGIYAAAAVIPIQVTFSDPVIVTGTPTLALDTGGTASYAGGSGTSTLTFDDVVAPGEATDDLDYASTTALALAGGTIADSVGDAASLTLPAPGAAGSLGASKSIVIDAVAPVVSAIGGPAAYASSTTAALSYAITEAHPGTTTCTQTAGTGTVATCTLAGATLTGLGQGPHTVSVTHTDAAGNVSSARTFSWTVDTVAPVVSPITGPSAYTSATSASLGFTIAEANPGTTTCTQTAGAGTVTACTATGASLVGLGEGLHTISVTHTDLAGNVSSARTFSWTVDTTAPVVSTIAGPPAYASSTSASLAFSITEMNPGTTTCTQTAGTGTLASCTGNGASFSNLSQGLHSVAITHTDLAGNTSAARTYAWTVDTIAPVISTISGPASPTSATDATLTYSITEANPGTTTCTQTVGAGVETNCDGATAAYSNLSAGAHTVSITQTDLAGNVSTARAFSWNVCPASAFTTATSGTAFVVPSGCGTQLEIWAWGAGGGASPWEYGGGGGFSHGTLAVTPGQMLMVAVGGGGGEATDRIGGSAGQVGGGAGGSGSDSATYGGGGGGGLSGVFVGSTWYLVAGGGGGGASNAIGTGGGGGGLAGGPGASHNDPVDGPGGTQTGGGVAVTGASITPGGDGSEGTGGAGASLYYGAGGGGGGYYGGAGGGATGTGYYGAGGGGSGFLSASMTGATTVAGSGTTPGGSTDPHYVYPHGLGGHAGSSGNPSGDGLVVLVVHP